MVLPGTSFDCDTLRHFFKLRYSHAVLLKVALPGSHYLIVFNMVLTCCHFEFGSLWQYFLLIYSSSQSVLIVMLLRRTLICHSPWQFFWLGHSMAVLLIVAFPVVILNLALPCSSFDYVTSWIPFDCDANWKYFCLWHFPAVFWTVMLPCNPFIVTLSDSSYTLWQSFCFWHSLEILLFAALHCNHFETTR